MNRRLAAFLKNPWLQDCLALASIAAMAGALMLFWVAFAGIAGSIQ